MNKTLVAKKFLFSVMTLLTLASLNFFILQALNQPSLIYLDIDRRYPPPFEWLEKRYGLNQPIHVRYIRFMADMFTLNFGPSFVSLRPVMADLWNRLPYTLSLLVPALIFTIFVSVPAEIHTLTNKNGGSTKTKLLTAIGGLSTWHIPAKNHLINTQMKDYMLLRRAVGFDERITLCKTAFMNTVPLLTLALTLSLPLLIAGTILAEHVFSLRGIGTWYTFSLMAYDLPVTEALLFIFETLTVSAWFLTSLTRPDTS